MSAKKEVLNIYRTMATDVEDVFLVLSVASIIESFHIFCDVTESLVCIKISKNK